MMPVRHYHIDPTPAESGRAIERMAARQRVVDDVREVAWCALYALGGAAVALLVGALA